MISVIRKVDHAAPGSVPYGAGEAAEWPIGLIQLVRIDFTGSPAVSSRIKKILDRSFMRSVGVNEIGWSVSHSLGDDADEEMRDTREESTVQSRQPTGA
jgi:hypothetical protein